ncbi:MAG: hypothetical protein AMXMBFR82_21950 [Candidatus Hydrogenedentota bacterium]
MQMLSTKHRTVTGYDFTKDKPLIRSRAIRQKCRECTNSQQAEIRRCQMTDCPLWPWRLGRRLRPGEETLHRANSATNAVPVDI